ncbi:Uncharacterized conserved protein, implicated in type VI secretion and phage assembly [Pedobacter steynii]|uniref:Uncharacterized conserved protein, implicated in type VI secretion and phage assembly n=1 Tax=Pedobacter steynii TaxID=430522 RepID=A0A1G9J0A6_9SPHI|nr:phage baseplate assembly protein V [Pedobacter steynii]NQX38102.1 type IV secretion protein Rhs [Pedobacter steynii]SDL30909.1 Uncharacterized conserved protein, implicated in type VI secretion and phage assembly [Pedobacter steynii]
MENKLIVKINIEDKEILHFISFNLQQQFNQHHYFELRINHDEMGLPGLINLNTSRDYVGKAFTISFGHEANKLQDFAGLITKVELAQSHGYHGVLVLSGYSPTILIDRGEDLGSYLDKTLDDIVNLATVDTPQNDLRFVANSSRKAPIDYVIQYKESDFEFLNRLSGQYHEWFYYDGRQLNFGKPEELKEVALFYGRDVQNFQYGMEAAPIKNKRFMYSSKQDQMLNSESAGKVEGVPDLTHAIQASNLMYSKTYNQPSLIRIDNSNDIKNHVENEEKARISELLKIHASGDQPQLSIGSIAEISMSIRQDLSFKTDSIGKFLITSINHTINGTGKYNNTFEGVMSTTERLLVKNYANPNPDMQLAQVVDNNDPDGLGRIKVLFKWECLTNDHTEWLRIVSPSAGTGDRGNNRGYFAIPEIGDQVMIGFEEGNIARPVVMGSIYHRSNVDSSPQIKNHLKSLTTRSGHLIEFDDSEGTQGIKITDIHENIIHIDTKGNNITITALENMTLNCKNMQINVTENMNTNVGKNISESAGEDISIDAGRNMTQYAGQDISMTAIGDFKENANNKTEMVEKAYTRGSMESTQYAEKVTIFSTKENMLLESSEKTVEINSAEKSNLF